MTVTVLKHATIYTGLERIDDGYVRFDDKILAVGDMFDYRAQSGEQTFDLQGKTLIPGFIDVHAHGGYGFDAMDGDADQIDEMATKMMTHEGVTTLFATTMTQSTENIDKAMRGVKQAAERNHIIQGVHLEGPFISKVFKGAQPEEYIKNPNGRNYPVVWLSSSPMRQKTKGHKHLKTTCWRTTLCLLSVTVTLPANRCCIAKQHM